MYDKSSDYYSIKRKKMIETQIISRGISDRRVLDVMSEIPRHIFVPEREIENSYDDHPLSINEGQTISQPYIVALMTELLELKGDEKVLEIGMGSGYQTAILSRLSKEVYSMDIKEQLVGFAQNNLEKLKIKNVTSKAGNGYLGWKEFAPFNVILIACAPEEIPEKLKEQMAEGARMVLPLKNSLGFQDLILIKKKVDNFSKSSYGGVIFVPMIGKQVIEDEKVF